MFNQGTTEILLNGQHDFDSGVTGLAFEGCKFVFHTGSVAAHDLIEHVNGVENIGTVTDELQAIGACHYTRYQNGYNVTEEGMVTDLITTAIESINCDFGPTIPQQHESDNDESFKWIIQEFRRKILDNLFDEAIDGFNINNFCDQALQGMRLGESKQDERFESNWQACEVFQAVEDSINKHFGISKTYAFGAKNHFECFEGQPFKLTIIKDDEHGLRVLFDDYYGIDEDLCTECGSVLEDDFCEDCEGDED